MKAKSIILCMILVLALMLTMLGGCSGKGSAPEKSTDASGTGSTAAPAAETANDPYSKPINMSFASWAFSEEALKPSYSGAITSYTDKHANIKLDMVTNPYAQYLEQLIVSAAAKNAPEFAHVKDEWIPQLTEMGALLSLDDYLSDDIKKDYLPAAIGSETINGKIMGAPWFSSPYIYYYNKTLLEQAGCTVPTNWKEFVDVIYKVAALGVDAAGNKYYGVGVPNSESQVGAGYQSFPYWWVYGGDFVDKNGNVVINTPENIEAFTMIRKLYKDEVSPNGLLIKELRNLFGQGHLGFFLDPEAGVKICCSASPKGNDFRKEVGAILFPAMDGPDGKGFNVCHAVVAFNTCDDTAIINDLVDHMTGEGVEVLYKGGQGKLPCRTSKMNEGVFAKIDDEITKTYMKSLSTARSIPLHVSLMEADARVNEALAELAITDTPVETIVENLDRDVKKIYGQ